MLGGVGMTVAENIDAGTVWVNGMMSSWGYQVSLSLGSLSLSIYLSISVCVSYSLTPLLATRPRSEVRSRRVVGAPTGSKALTSI